MKELNKKLADIQQKLKAPKGQTNDFAHFKYRSCEDILEAVKPLLGELTLTISDEVVVVGDRYYVKATATLTEGKIASVGDSVDSMSVSAFAREAESKAGMDVAQITGASSSYARKYALNGLFAIDDTQDADTKDNTVKEVKTTTNSPSSTPPTIGGLGIEESVKKISPSLRQIEAVVKIAKQNGEEISFSEVQENWTAKQASDYISEKGNGGYYKARENK